MRALILQNQATPEQITSYHIGFVLGPCVNASGRLETAKIALNLFLQKNETDAGKIAKELVELNAQRKSMTADGVELAKQIVDEGTAGEKVLVIYLPGVHESLAGIIAGENQGVLPQAGICSDGRRGRGEGSGRSTEAYSMYDECASAGNVFQNSGGHPMAWAGCRLREDVAVFRGKINACCELTEEDFIPKIRIRYGNACRVSDDRADPGLARLEPFGMATVSRRCGQGGFGASAGVCGGQETECVKELSLATAAGEHVSAGLFWGCGEAWKQYYSERSRADGGETLRAKGRILSGCR